MNGRSLIEIFLTSESFVLTYGTAFLVLCPDKNLESEFEHITEGIQQVKIPKANFKEGNINISSTSIGRTTEVWSLEQAPV